MLQRDGQVKAQKTQTHIYIRQDRQRERQKERERGVRQRETEREWEREWGETEKD